MYAASSAKSSLSFPVRERGLKLCRSLCTIYTACVVPRAGTWIETSFVNVIRLDIVVVPRAGTWIETTWTVSMPPDRTVGPRAGTWIDTHCIMHNLTHIDSRSPCGNVD